MTDFEPPGEGYFPSIMTSGTPSVPSSRGAPPAFLGHYHSCLWLGFLKATDCLSPPAYDFQRFSRRRIGESWSLALTALNATNHRYLLDEGNSFEGTHFADPRRISLELRYHFHY